MSPILSGLGGITVKGYGHFGPTRFAVSGAMEPIAVATVPSGGLSSITFGNIPQTYTHLQLRSTVRPTIASDVVLRLNSDSTAANYYTHYINSTGNGSVGASAANTYYSGGMGIGYHNLDLANAFGVHITDIVDYTNTNKNTTIRTLFATEYNTSGGQTAFISGVWFNTAAVTSLTLFLLSGSGNVFAQNSSIALYGIKGA